MEPCQPTMESSVTQSAAGQRALFLYRRARIFSPSDLTALTEGKCQTGKKGDELAEGFHGQPDPRSPKALWGNETLQSL